VVKKVSPPDRFFKELQVLCALAPLREVISSADLLLACDVDKRALYLKYKGKLTLKQFGKRNATDQQWIEVLRLIAEQVCLLLKFSIYPGDLHTENVVLDVESRPHLIDVENWKVGWLSSRYVKFRYSVLHSERACKTILSKTDCPKLSLVFRSMFDESDFSISDLKAAFE
jgi:hypothetical protein